MIRKRTRTLWRLYKQWLPNDGMKKYGLILSNLILLIGIPLWIIGERIGGVWDTASLLYLLALCGLTMIWVMRADREFKRSELARQTAERLREGEEDEAAL